MEFGVKVGLTGVGSKTNAWNYDKNMDKLFALPYFLLKKFLRIFDYKDIS